MDCNLFSDVTMRTDAGLKMRRARGIEKMDNMACSRHEKVKVSR